VIDQKKLGKRQWMAMPNLGIGIYAQVSRCGCPARIQVIQNTTLQSGGWLIRDRAIDLKILDSSATLASQRRTHTAGVVFCDDFSKIRMM
jgi:hypothetical protein